MGALRRNIFILTWLALVAACASSETRSLVSKDDIPASKYQNVAVFVENLDGGERSKAEQIIVSALKNAGVNATSGLDAFKGRGTLSDKAKADLIQRQFDAVLYLTVLENAVVEERVPNAFFDGQNIQYNMGIVTVSHNVTGLYDVQSDGSVYQPILALKTKADVQDTKSAKQVWTSETISTGNAKTTSMSALLVQASNQIVAKLQEDSAI